MKKKKPKQDKEKVKQTPPQPEEIKEERFDFGGLPTRDIKKNLGCG
jgi:hypothetical protein